jgi:hypothetical protein
MIPEIAGHELHGVVEVVGAEYEVPQRHNVWLGFVIRRHSFTPGVTRDSV